MLPVSVERYRIVIGPVGYKNKFEDRGCSDEGTSVISFYEYINGILYPSIKLQIRYRRMLDDLFALRKYTTGTRHGTKILALSGTRMISLIRSINRWNTGRSIIFDCRECKRASLLAALYGSISISIAASIGARRLFGRREILTGGPSAGSPRNEGGRCRGLSGLGYNRRYCRAIRRRTVCGRYQVLVLLVHLDVEGGSR